MKTAHTRNLLAVTLFCTLAFTTAVAKPADPLPSWNNGAAKASIVDFVAKVTKKGSPDYVARGWRKYVSHLSAEPILAMTMRRFFHFRGYKATLSREIASPSILRFFKRTGNGRTSFFKSHFVDGRASTATSDEMTHRPANVPQ